VVILIIPVAYVAMSGISQQAQVLHDTIIQGELAYVKVASDADALRASSIDAATNPDQGKTEASYLTAKAAMEAFPKDARDMEDLTSKDPAVAPLVVKFKASSSMYDFQAITAVTDLGNGKKADALNVVHGASYAAYQQQSRDGEALLAALKKSSDVRFAALLQARNFALGVQIVGAAIAALIALCAMLWFRRAMSRGLERVLEVFEAMERGNLTARVGWSGRDLLGRLGQAVDQLGESLSQIIATIQHAVMTVQNASQQTNETARQVESRVAEELLALARAADF
ncbi:MAG: HAMP domain-containing protein, partial [Candidatus Baltobacteraceae bacterium]